MKCKKLVSLILALCMVLSWVPVVALHADAADPVSMMVSYAQARVGKTGQELGYTDQWCAFFVCDCAVYAGQSKAIPYNGNAHTLYFAVLNAGGNIVSSPRAGDLVFYNCTACDTNNDGISIMHVGLVENENYSIEGNLDGSSYATRTVKRKALTASYSHGSGHSTSNYVRRIYVRPNYSGLTTHTVDTSYGTNFTAYPKAKITAENIFDAYHNQIDSSSWIGTTDQCTIHEVYTDGCCKVTYPLDAGGTKTVYSKISLFNTHTHSYTGTRVYESAHPHEITQRCVDYATCGGYIHTGEYYEVKTCEQCWHADFDIGASSVSVKVGESKTVAVSVGGCLPDSAVAYPSFSPDNNVVEVTIKNQQATFTRLKEGTTLFQIRIYSDSSKSYLIGTTSIRVDIATPTYTVVYNANGGSGAPSTQTKSHGTDLTLSSTIPIRFGYNFIGWSTSSSATSATYQPGDTYSNNAPTTLYAVWDTPYEVSGNFGSYALGRAILYPNVGVYYKFIPYVSTKYRISGADDADTQVYLYDASGNQLATDDDSGTGNQFQLDYLFTAGETYYIYVRFYSSSATGYLDFNLLKGYTLSYDANGGSSAPSRTYKYYGVDTTLSSIVPVRTGYTFLGWSTNPVATSASYQPGATFKTNANTTLYAVWQQECASGHRYDDIVTAPTCTSAGYTTHTCTRCGDSYVDSYVSAKGHSYTDSVTDPTCTKQGYTTHTCSVCGDSYVDSYVKALGHEYEDGICIRCGEADPDYAAPVADEVIRLSGKGRCETAILIAEELKETLEVEKFNTIIIANGNNFADALAGSYLAAAKDAPILLSWGSNDKHAANIQYIKDNLVSGGTVYILGGTAAVPGLYEEGLEGIHVERLSGKSRFDTNIEILEEAGIDANSEILVSTGWNYADSLSASATGKPILLLNTNTGKLEESQTAFLSELEEKNCTFTIIGGTGAVSAELAADLEAYGNVDRISGKTRYETSVKVAEAYFEDPESAVLAYGRNFPDGLCGGALAFSMNAPLILTQTGAETAAAGYIQGQGIKFGVVLGGESLISQESIQKIFGTN